MADLVKINSKHQFLAFTGNF